MISQCAAAVPRERIFFEILFVLARERGQGAMKSGLDSRLALSRTANTPPLAEGRDLWSPYCSRPRSRESRAIKEPVGAAVGAGGNRSAPDKITFLLLSLSLFRPPLLSSFSLLAHSSPPDDFPPRKQGHSHARPNFPAARLRSTPRGRDYISHIDI